MAAVCYSCRAPRRWRFAGPGLREPRPEPGTKPDPLYFACVECGYIRVAYADVADVENLVQVILRERNANVWESDRDEAAGDLRLTAWRAYLKFDPGLGVSFTAYASGMLRFALTRWIQNRAGRSKVRRETSEVSIEGADGGLDGAIAEIGGRRSVDRSPDLARLLESGSGGASGDETDDDGEPLGPRLTERAGNGKLGSRAAA